jgi:succinate dehydrogenase / fumarate reductase cytochrome b subunit
VPPLVAFYRSPLGKKLITGISGLVMATFVLVHMLGNLVFLVSPDAYNQYGHFLESLGPLVWLIELVLLLAVGLHAALGIQIYRNKLRARPTGYERYVSAGAPSVQSLSSRTMIWTGLVLAVFLVWHLLTFKFGPVYRVGGSGVRDLARLVTETFQQPIYSSLYTAAMLFLGLHLRHGIWSALQSIGAMSAGLKPLVYSLSLLLAIGIALGFGLLPGLIYFGLIG